MAVPLHVPMTDVARDALIATAVLWVAFAIVVFLRLLGRFQGAGVGADDVLSLLALVCLEQCDMVVWSLLTIADTGFYDHRIQRCW